ncbi:DUF7269 family protein [Halocatena marina]|uniref:Uncharacterized protein n=1 Tax=Halocatena marina TaxID=2934937 RepID=A0ABD5YUG0_9EURY|nr:hypothetical protein [Halocatena marina]
MNRLFLASGVIAALFGVIVIADPSVLARIGISFPSVLVVVIGGIAIIESVRAGYSRFTRSITNPNVPDPECRSVASVLGTELDTQLTDVTRRTRAGGVRDRKRIRERLTETAIEILVRYDGDSPERARERLQDGSWTTDPVAAAFFASVDAFHLPLTDRLRMTVIREAAFSQQARRAITALADRTEPGRTVSNER